MTDKDHSSVPTEIELSFVIEDLTPVIQRAKKLYSNPLEEINVSRIIYKNNGDFHIRSSEETRGGSKTHIISLKEDLMKQGVTSGMKKALEVDVDVSETQQSSFIEMFKLIGFKETTRFNKHRVSFTTGEVQIDLDSYDLPEGKVFNVEIEGPTEEAIYAVANALFPDGLPVIKK